MGLLYRPQLCGGRFNSGCRATGWLYIRICWFVCRILLRALCSCAIGKVPKTDVGGEVTQLNSED